jgi:lipoprotein-anchoring transpeptidase ErfK/SrfK
VVQIDQSSQRMARHYFSRKYDNAPMRYAIFFHYGFAAIQGTNDGSRLGGPALHGCVRLHPSHAAALLALVERNGRAICGSRFSTRRDAVLTV